MCVGVLCAIYRNMYCGSVCYVQVTGTCNVRRCALCKLPVNVLCFGVLCASYRYINCVSVCSVQVSGI